MLNNTIVKTFTEFICDGDGESVAPFILGLGLLCVVTLYRKRSIPADTLQLQVNELKRKVQNILSPEKTTFRFPDPEDWPVYESPAEPSKKKIREHCRGVYGSNWWKKDKGSRRKQAKKHLLQSRPGK